MPEPAKLRCAGCGATIDAGDALPHTQECVHHSHHPDR